MRRLTLTRKLQSDHGTFGRLHSSQSGPGLSLYTAELPWRGNRRGVSRIPAGLYRCAPYSSPKFPNVFEILDVPGREAILIHAGNWAGDVSKGYRSDVEGCVLVGMEAGQLNGQPAVLKSRDAMTLLRKWAGPGESGSDKAEFELEIIEEWQG